MKISTLSLILALISAPLIAQNQIAFTDVEKGENISNENKIKIEVFKNNDFIVSFNENSLPKTIVKINRLIANFEVESLNNFSESERYLYTVNFDESKHKIKTVYDHDGNVVRYEGKFENVRIPYKITRDVIKSHPGWSIKSTKCLMKYDQDSKNQVTFKLTLEKDGQIKRITVS